MLPLTPIASTIQLNNDFIPTETELQAQPQPSTSFANQSQNKEKISQNITSPEVVRPFPKAPKRKANNVGRVRKGKSRVYTDTPEKNRIMEIALQKKSKEKGTQHKRKILQEKPASSCTKPAQNYESSSSDSDIFFSSDLEGKISESEDEGSLPTSLTDDVELGVGNYVLVKFPTKSNIIYYIGRILEIVIDKWEFSVKFLRKKRDHFVYPDIEDISLVNRCDVQAKLPDPLPHLQSSKRKTAAAVKFDINFNNYNVN